MTDIIAAGFFLKWVHDECRLGAHVDNITAIDERLLLLLKSILFVFHSTVSVKRCGMSQKHLQSLPSFGKRLKRLRLVAGMKQSALSELLNINQTTVSRWEAGVQVPDFETQQASLGVLSSSRTDDSALKRLVQQSTGCVHLVEESSHVCLAYSQSRSKDWNTTNRALLGVSLWQFASDEIREAESQLDALGWWDTHNPAPKAFETSEMVFDEIRISAGGILWERLYLSDGTSARLVSGLPMIA